MLPRQRFGNFLFIIGLVMLLYFFASDQSENPQFLLFFAGMLFSILGLVLRLGFRSAPDESQRFRLLRKIGERFSRKKK